MAITLDGTNGILSPDFEPSSSTTPTNGLFLPAANALGFATNSTERLRLDASGNLGVGTTSPTYKLTVAGYSNVASSNKFAIGGTADYQALLYMENATETFTIENTSDYAASAIILKTNNAERARIDSSGNLLVGKTASSQTSGEGVQLSPTTAAVNSYMAIVSPNSLTGTNIISAYSTGAANFRFYVQWDGKIYATSTSITAISDISLKENIRPLETGLAEVLALKPRRFDWKNGDGNNVAGFIAQEVETVLPDLVSDYKYNEEETKRGLKMGDMIPTLVKAIQELTARLEALENK